MEIKEETILFGFIGLMIGLILGGCIWDEIVTKDALAHGAANMVLDEHGNYHFKWHDYLFNH